MVGRNNHFLCHFGYHIVESSIDHRVSVFIVVKIVASMLIFINSIWTKYTFIAIPGSMVIWFVFLPLVAYVGPLTPWDIFLEYNGIVPQLFGNVNYWLFFIVVPLACVLRDYLWK